jgi:hypothetical protein
MVTLEICGFTVFTNFRSPPAPFRGDPFGLLYGSLSASAARGG